MGSSSYDKDLSDDDDNINESGLFSFYFTLLYFSLFKTQIAIPTTAFSTVIFFSERPVLSAI